MKCDQMCQTCGSVPLPVFVDPSLFYGVEAELAFLLVPNHHFLSFQTLYVLLDLHSGQSSLSPAICFPSSLLYCKKCMQLEYKHRQNQFCTLHYQENTIVLSGPNFQKPAVKHVNEHAKAP